MFKIPGAFKRNPFLVWGCFVATVIIFVLLFGQEEIMGIIHWSIGMSEEKILVIETIEESEK